MPRRKSAINEEKSECPRCQGGHYLVQAAQDRAGTILLPCPSCLPPGKFTFNNFEATQGTGAALKAAKAWAEGKGPPWLVLLGGHGSGKTHLARAAHRGLIDRLQWVRYIYSIEIFDSLQRAFHYREEPELTYQVEQRYLEAPNLVIDDLGAERDTPWVQERAEKILNTRYERELRTFITSNRGLEDFPGPIRSRLGDRRLCLVVHMKAGDYRLRGKEQGVA